MISSSIGLIGALLFTLSGVPFAYETFKAGRTDTSTSGILMILGGSVAMFIYELSTSSKIFSLIDFLVCAVCWSIVLKYKLIPRSKV